MEFRRDVLRSKRPLLVLTQVGGGMTWTQEKTTREFAPGKDVWVPSYWSKTGWSPTGEVFQKVFLPDETLNAPFGTLDEEAIGTDSMNDEIRIPPIPIDPVNPELFWTNDIDKMRAYCNPFDFSCRLDLLPDCSVDYFNTTIQVSILLLLAKYSWNYLFMIIIGCSFQ